MDHNEMYMKNELLFPFPLSLSSTSIIFKQKKKIIVIFFSFFKCGHSKKINMKLQTKGYACKSGCII